jgi:acyl carrier protein
METKKLTPDEILKIISNFASEILNISEDKKLELNTRVEDFLSKAFHFLDFAWIIQEMENYFDIKITDKEARSIEKIEDLVSLTKIKIEMVSMETKGPEVATT